MIINKSNMEAIQFKIGEKVNVKCPVYRNGRKFTGIITMVSIIFCMVKIDGNYKSTKFAKCWIEPLNWN